MEFNIKKGKDVKLNVRPVTVCVYQSTCLRALVALAPAIS